MPYKDKQIKSKYDKLRRDTFHRSGGCVQCGEPATNSKFCVKHSKYFTNMAKAIQTERLSAGLCRGCGASPAKGHRDCQKCLDRQALNQAKRAMKLKEETFSKYGGMSCACDGCGWHDGRCIVTHTDVLTLDHINNDGAEQRKTLGTHGKGHKFYVWLKKNGYPSGYRVLCMNCNWGKYLMIQAIKKSAKYA